MSERTSRLPHIRRMILSACSALLLLTPVAVEAQAVPVERPPASPIQVSWWEGAAIIGGLAVFTWLDAPINDEIERGRSGSSDAIADGFRVMGTSEVYGTVALGAVATGLLSGDPELRGAGWRVASSVALAAASTRLIKFAAGRSRPAEDGNGLDPFSGKSSFPSGHTTMAFALATSLSDEIDRPLVTLVLYTAAAGTGWSRMNDHVHWFSDVLAGALLGYASAKFASGRMEIMGLKAPSIIPREDGMAIQWSESW